MSSLQDTDALAQKRYMIMNAVRIVAIGAVIVGIAIARSLVDLPYALGVVLALAGMIAFFFAPPMLAKKWKSDAGDEQE